MLLRTFSGLSRATRCGRNCARRAPRGPRTLETCCYRSDMDEAQIATLRTVAQGELFGLVTGEGAHSWRGIPFAASTAGENRWRAPRPAPAWEGRRAALTFADRCAQLTTVFDKKEGLSPGQLIGSEDCLALDIYAPTDAQGEGLPVMVWIHGGYNVWGRSSSYNGSKLALEQGVIVVAVQYRLGPLGWFAHEALRASAELPEDGAACFAILDLIASLRWVRDNIAAFGGDPSCVTIFGESAGGHNVAMLLASPLAKGLFHRAIVQSGSFDSLALAVAEGDEGGHANPAKTIVEALDARSAQALRATSLAQLFAAYSIEGNFLDLPRGISDGVVLPATPLREAFASRETFNCVPIMSGTTRDEMKLFYLGNETFTKKRLGVFPVARDQELFDALTHYISRIWRVRAVDEPAAMMRKAGHDSVYAYRFDWDEGGRFLFMNFKKLLGAAHGFEIPFVFHHFHHLGPADAVLFKRSTLAEREELSRIMGGYWASFARAGVPAHPGAPAWPCYGEEGSFMRLDTENDGGVELRSGSDSIGSIIVDLKRDPRLDEAERFMIVAEIDNWMFTRPLRARFRAEFER